MTNIWYLWAEIVRLVLAGLYDKHAAQSGCWVATQFFCIACGKRGKTLIQLAGRRTFRMQSDF